MIHIKGLHKFFNKGKQNEIHVINDISLELPECGMVAIFGPSGCGKTTLLNVIGGLDKYADGELTIENQSIRENTDLIRNNYIGYIFQNYNLNKLESCYDNVADALRLCGMTDEKEIEERVIAALTNVGMEKYKKRTPDTLSGGQQQRIAIARAIVKNPRIILADEPTGNLDEANTVMIMDLLKAISKDHLVLLVTHEANLVDYYCDTVIELQDGKIVNTKENSAANGFSARDKNDLYLGELQKSTHADESTEIEYYGDIPEKPIKIKIVNSGGKIYLKLETQTVQILDEFSEIKLKDGVYEQATDKNDVSKDIDMSKLPPIKGTRFGHLFTLKSSIKSGYQSNFRGTKKGKKVLRRCMSLFAAVVVFMSAVFGTAFGDLKKVKNSYNHNVFYVYTPDAEVSQKINSAVGNSDTGINHVHLNASFPNGDETLYFRAGSFETFEQYDYYSNYETNAVYLDVSLCKDLKLVAGKKENLENHEIVISTGVADDLLEKSSLGYITEYRDLIGLISTNSMTIDGKNTQIAGIVESDESAVYLSEIALAKRVRMQAVFPSYTELASDYGLSLNEGEAILTISTPLTGTEYPTVGQTIKIRGRDIKIVEIRKAYDSYESFLLEKGIQKTDVYTYFENTAKAQYPTLNVNTPEFTKAVDQLYNTRFFEYYDYYYSEADAFLYDSYLFNRDRIELWMYFDLGIEEAKYHFLQNDYYNAFYYKKLHGRYPTLDELELNYDAIPTFYQLAYPYEQEFYMNNSLSSIYYHAYMISDEDFIAFSKQLGETHPSATYSYKNAYPSEKYAEGSSIIESYDISIDMDVSVDYIDEKSDYYTIIHSNDPKKTAEWLASEFSDLESPHEFYEPIITPDSIFKDKIANSIDDILSSLITMAIIIVLMSLCMYFIMRSSLMNRIKEIGVYRAIGVSKKNLIFKFLIESLVLTTLTVLVGYIFCSAFMFVALASSPLMKDIFYYPLWLALSDFVILYAISLFFGTLPIIALLRKTPSEILSKYDI